MKIKKKKLKIKKSVSHRFRITKKGKVMRLSSFARHLKRKKSKKQLRRLKKAKVVKGRFAIKVKKMLGHK